MAVSSGEVTATIDARQRVSSLLWAVIESAPVAMILSDTAGQVVLANREAETLMCYEAGAMLGVNVDRLVPAVAREEHAIAREDFVKRPQARSTGPVLAMRRDGREVPVEVTLKPVSTHGALYVLAVITDISGLEVARHENALLEQRVRERTAEIGQQTEELRRANQALERSNTQLQQFAYITSHDLQSPLRAISGFLQLLQRRYADKLDSQGQAWIAAATNGAQRMNTLIRDVLEYSRVDARARPFERVPMNDVFADALQLLDVSIRDAGATIERDDLPEVQGDRSQLLQLLQHLLDNALKYHGPQRPRVHVSVRRLEHDWEFSVRDNGIGIAPEYHERIFEIFRRLHSKSAYPGTGIGLAICQRVVHRHGGRIAVESALGQGATFRFTLPLN